MDDRQTGQYVVSDPMSTSTPAESGETSGGGGGVTEKAMGAASKAQEQLQGAAGPAMEKAGQVKEQATQQVDTGLDKAAGGLDKLADTVRQQAEGGKVPGQATMVAEKLDSAASYLRDKDTDQLMTDLEALVRRKPVESMAAAIGVGFLLSKALR